MTGNLTAISAARTQKRIKTPKKCPAIATSASSLTDIRSDLQVLPHYADTSDDGLLLDLLCVLVKNKKRCCCQIRKIKKLGEKLASEQLNTTKKLTLAAMRDKVIGNGKRDIASQKSFTNTKHIGDKPLTCYIDDLCTETPIRYRWHELLFIKIKLGAVHLLDDHMVITEKEMIYTKHHRTIEMYKTENNIFVAA